MLELWFDLEPEIIGEIGVNWNGSLELAHSMVESCKKAGCTAVKFQAFGPEHWKNYPQFPQLKNCTITKDNIKVIDFICERNNIEWFCTPTYPKAVDMLEKYVYRYKIRYADQNNYELQKKIFSKRKEVIASSTSSRFYPDGVKTLYCIPKYPCKYEEIEFDKLGEFYGYSNHCKSKKAVIKAAKLGAKMIEVHVTMNYEYPFIDNPVSFDFEDLENIIRKIHSL